MVRVTDSVKDRVINGQRNGQRNGQLFEYASDSMVGLHLDIKDTNRLHVCQKGGDVSDSVADSSSDSLADSSSDSVVGLHLR